VAQVVDANVFEVGGGADAPPRALKVCDVLAGEGADDDMVVVGQAGQGSQD